MQLLFLHGMCETTFSSNSMFLLRRKDVQGSAQLCRACTTPTSRNIHMIYAQFPALRLAASEYAPRLEPTLAALPLRLPPRRRRCHRPDLHPSIQRRLFAHSRRAAQTQQKMCCGIYEWGVGVGSTCSQVASKGGPLEFVILMITEMWL